MSERSGWTEADKDALLEQWRREDEKRTKPRGLRAFLRRLAGREKARRDKAKPGRGRGVDRSERGR